MSVPRSARLRYYLDHLCSMIRPRTVYQRQLEDLLKEGQDNPEVQKRANYYCGIHETFELSDDVEPFRCRPWKGQSTYQLDLQESLRYFPKNVRVEKIFGDNIQNPPRPALVKSRPVGPAGSNGVLLKLNRIRHFRFVEDNRPFADKKNLLVWRGNASQPHRRDFMERFFDHPLCNVGHYYHRPVANMPWKRGELSIRDQLAYKFILALEGNDVATNLKWVLSSNSLCIMPPCRYETWFMEGRLESGVHYVEIASDGSDLEKKMTYYLEHPDKAEAIIHNANAWVKQFQDKHTEHVIALQVLQRYFQRSGQL